MSEGVTLTKNHHLSKPAVSSVASEGHVTVSNIKTVVPKKQVVSSRRWLSTTQYGQDQFHMVPKDVCGH